jgi:hypothetical protein
MKISALQETDAEYFSFIKFMFCFWTLHVQERPLQIIFHSGCLWKFKKTMYSVKVKLSMCLTKHYVMEAYGGVDV